MRATPIRRSRRWRSAGSGVLAAPLARELEGPLHPAAAPQMVGDGAAESFVDDKEPPEEPQDDVEVDADDDADDAVHLVAIAPARHRRSAPAGHRAHQARPQSVEETPTVPAPEQSSGQRHSAALPPRTREDSAVHRPPPTTKPRDRSTATIPTATASPCRNRGAPSGCRRPRRGQPNGEVQEQMPRGRR